MKLRVGFLLDPNTWLGGLNYFRNLLQALDRLPNSRLCPVIITGKDVGTLLEGFPQVAKVRTRLMDRGSLPWWSRKLLGKALAGDWLLERLLARHKIDVLSHRAPLVPFGSTPSVGWIPDFQHTHLPEFFTPDEVRVRDREFMLMCERCTKVIVSSECALADFRAFAPRYASKGEVLHFVADSVDEANVTSIDRLSQSYDLPRHYFLLPNQFWIHKNHRTVITALKIAKQRNNNLVVLATGSTRDHRQPGHFDELMRYAAECDVLEHFRSLGVVPFADLAGLMRNAVALINPSLFEGWSTSVEEAKSLGKRILLSDIPVHREQAPEFGIFFSPHDAHALADLMQQSLVEFNPRADLDARKDAERRLTDRQVAFAANFERIVAPQLCG